MSVDYINCFSLRLPVSEFQSNVYPVSAGSSGTVLCVDRATDCSSDSVVGVVSGLEGQETGSEHISALRAFWANPRRALSRVTRSSQVSMDEKKELATVLSNTDKIEGKEKRRCGHDAHQKCEACADDSVAGSHSVASLSNVSKHDPLGLCAEGLVRLLGSNLYFNTRCFNLITDTILKRLGLSAFVYKCSKNV